MFVLFAAVIYGGGGAILGGIAGTLVGAFLWLLDLGRRSGERGGRAAAGCGTIALCGGIGAMLGGGVGLYMAYQIFFGDGPSHGYPDRAAYRTAEIQARVAQLDPTIAALGKFKADHAKYPAQLHELVTGGYLANLPQAGQIDHLGSPDRIHGSNTYFLSPQADAYVLVCAIGFEEDRRGLGNYHEQWVNDSRDPGWRPGSAPPGWPGYQPLPPPAPAEEEHKQ